MYKHIYSVQCTVHHEISFPAKIKYKTSKLKINRKYVSFSRTCFNRNEQKIYEIFFYWQLNERNIAEKNSAWGFFIIRFFVSLFSSSFGLRLMSCSTSSHIFYPIPLRRRMVTIAPKTKYKRLKNYRTFELP